MKTLSIKNLVILVGVIVTLIQVVLFTLTSTNNHKQHQYQALFQYLEETDIDMLMLRRLEKDFIMRLDSKYITQHIELRPRVKLHLDKIHDIAEDLGETWEEEDVSNSFQDYYGFFDQLVDQEKRIGLDEKSGLKGTLRKAIHGVEEISKAANDARLLAHTLMLRRHEKDFFLREDPKYLERHAQQIDVTKNYVEKNSNARNKRALLKGLDTYQADFLALADAMQLLGLDHKSGIKGEMRKAVHHLEEVLESEMHRLHEVAIEEDEYLGHLTEVIFIIGSLLILAVLALMVWQISQRSKDALSFVERLYLIVQNNDFASLSQLTVEGKDEFATISRQMEQLGQQIATMHSEMSAAEAASSRIKQALDVAKVPVMVADDTQTIIYQNESFTKLLAHRSNELSTVASSLSGTSALNLNADQLNTHLGYEYSIKGLKQSIEYQIEVEGVVIYVSAAPIFNEQQQTLGTVLEWSDETDRLIKEREEKRIADENAGIKIALDSCDTNVMIADVDYKISYMNDAVIGMMKDAEADLKVSIPNFDASNLMGQVIDVFHKNPAHQRGMLDGLTSVYRGRIRSGQRTFDLIATPMFNDNKERLGTVVEWDDISARLKEEEEAQKVANQNASIKLALDVCDTNVMMADAEYNINYMNDAVRSMMKVAEADLKEVLPEFDAQNLDGKNIDIFHKNPAHQRSMLAKLTDVYRTEITVGRRTFSLTATPIFTTEKERLGTVVEWDDRTAEVAMEREMDELIGAANDGNLSKRINLEGKSGFFRGIGDGLNSLLIGLEAFISDMGGIFEAMAHGDLTCSIDREYKGQFEQIKGDANIGLTKLKESLTNIQRAAQTVGSSSNEVAQGTDDLSRRTESQASSLEETASSMEEITATVRQTADNADQSSQYAKEAKLRAENGGKVVNGAVTAMTEILRSSHQINDIIGVIDEIAFQTNLLALNAAVEAARAGEHGRGFAVVAGEVRTLSQRSAGAAKEIKDLIRDSVNKVETGSSLVNESGDVLVSIVQAVDQVAVMIDAVNNAAAEQINGISQINQAISSMDNMTQQNAALVEQSSAASRSMSDEASSMNQMIGFFKL
jgi:methyl-accepting chemotaxis protein